MGDLVLTVQLIYDQRLSPKYLQMWSLAASAVAWHSALRVSTIPIGLNM
jgi:hypothetical protein